MILTPALDWLLKHHPRHCAYWVFSGDRHCSYGRDKAIQELDMLKMAHRALIHKFQKTGRSGWRGPFQPVLF